MKFRIIDDKDGSNVLGGDVSENSAYISAYPVPLEGQVPIDKLGVGESTIVRYSLSGTSGVYRVLRVE